MGIQTGGDSNEMGKRLEERSMEGTGKVLCCVWFTSNPEECCGTSSPQQK